MVIKFTWEDGANDGSTPIIDYEVYYDEGTGSDTFVSLDNAVLNKFYETVVALTPGTTYRLKVYARNAVG